MRKKLYRFLNRDTATEFSAIFERVSDLRFTVSDVQISSRVLSYWASQGLLFEDFREAKWRKLDLVSVVWLKMILKMRTYGISFETIRKIRKDLQPMDLEDQIYNSQELRDALFALAEHDKRAIPDVEEILKDPVFRESVRSQLTNYLKVLILEAIILKEHSALLMNHDGVFLPYNEGLRKDYLEIPEFRKLMLGSYLTISLTDILIEFYMDHDPIFLNEKMMILSPEEAAVLQAIKQPGIKSVTVKLYPDEQYDMLEIVSDRQVDRSLKLYEVLLKDGYQEICIKTRNGEIVYCQNSTKIRFNKLGTG